MRVRAIVGFKVGDMTAWVGDYNKNIADGESAHKVCSLAIHPKFNDDKGDNDVSILHLCQPLQYTQSKKNTRGRISAKYFLQECGQSAWPSQA